MTIGSNNQYNSAQAYGTGQMVLLGSVVYQAVQDVPPNTAPPNGTYWEIVPVPEAPIGAPYLFRFPFAFGLGSAALAAGVPIHGYNPVAGDLITRAWFDVSVAFNGTTPKGDFGSFSSTLGVFKELNSNAVDLTAATAALTDNTGIDKIGGAVLVGQAGMPLRIVTSGVGLLLVVSEDGSKGGTGSGATAGSAILNLEIVPAA